MSNALEVQPFLLTDWDMPLFAWWMAGVNTPHTHLPSFYSFENAAFFLLIRDGQFEIIFQFPLYECAFSHIAELVSSQFQTWKENEWMCDYYFCPWKNAQYQQKCWYSNLVCRILNDTSALMIWSGLHMNHKNATLKVTLVCPLTFAMREIFHNFRMK